MAMGMTTEEEEDDTGTDDGGGEEEEERVIESIEFSEEAILALEQAINETDGFDFELISDILAPMALLSVLSIFWFGANGTFVRSARFFFGISKTLLLSIGLL